MSYTTLQLNTLRVDLRPLIPLYVVYPKVVKRSLAVLTAK